MGTQGSTKKYSYEDRLYVHRINLCGQACIQRANHMGTRWMHFKELILWGWNLYTKDQYYMGAQCVYKGPILRGHDACSSKEPMHDAGMYKGAVL